MSGILYVKDSRTSQTYTIEVIHNSIKNSDLANIKGPKDAKHLHGEKLRVFDPGYQNTAVMNSSITFA